MNKRFKFVVNLGSYNYNRPIGGIKQLFRLCEGLVSGGVSCDIRHTSGKKPSWFDTTITPSSSKNNNGEKEILILPEPNIPGIIKNKEKINKEQKFVIFNQNLFYTFGTSLNLNEENALQNFSNHFKEIIEFYNSNFVEGVVCISKSDYEFLSHLVNKNKLFLMRQGIETDLFRFKRKDKKALTFVLGKNNQLDIGSIMSLISTKKWAKEWSFYILNGQPHKQVANIFRNSLAYVSLFAKEGFGLPLVEAAASGCYLIGHTGVGGKEVFDIAEKYNTCQATYPYDYLSIVNAIEKLNDRFDKNKDDLNRSLLYTSQEISHVYEMKNMMRDSVQIFNTIENKLRNLENEFYY